MRVDVSSSCGICQLLLESWRFDFIIVTVNMACFDEPFYILAADNRAVVFVISFANNSYERTIPRITIHVHHLQGEKALLKLCCQSKGEVREYGSTGVLTGVQEEGEGERRPYHHLL